MHLFTFQSFPDTRASAYYVNLQFRSLFDSLESFERQPTKQSRSFFSFASKPAETKTEDVDSSQMEEEYLPVESEEHLTTLC